MKRHIVEIKELEDFTFERIVCASYPKKLSICVHPAKDHMHYKLELAESVVGTFNSLHVALLEYNEL